MGRSSDAESGGVELSVASAASDEAGVAVASAAASSSSSSSSSSSPSVAATVDAPLRKRGGGADGSEKKKEKRSRGKGSAGSLAADDADGAGDVDDGGGDDDDAGGAHKAGGGHAQGSFDEMMDYFGWHGRALVYWFGFHRAKLRYVHRGWVFAVLTAWSLLVLITDLQEGMTTIALAELGSILPFIFVTGGLLRFFHTDHLPTQVAIVSQVTGKDRSISRAIWRRHIALWILHFLLFISWQTVVYLALSAKPYEKNFSGGFLVVRIIIAGGYFLYTPLFLLLPFLWSVTVYLHVTHAEFVRRRLKAQDMALDTLREQIRLLERGVASSSKHWGWIIGVTLAFIVVDSALWIYIAIAEFKQLLYMYFALVPVVLGLLLLFEASRVGTALDDLREQAKRLAAHNTFSNPSYRREEVDSLLMYVFSSDQVFEIFGIPIRAGIFVGLLTFAATVGLVGLKVFLSGGDVAAALAD